MAGNPARGCIRTQQVDAVEEDGVPALLDALTSPAPVVLAPTGMVPTSDMTPHVPLTPAEVAARRRRVLGTRHHLGAPARARRGRRADLAA